MDNDDKGFTVMVWILGGWIVIMMILFIWMGIHYWNGIPA